MIQRLVEGPASLAEIAGPAPQAATIAGTGHRDDLTGGPGNDTISGLGGDDTLAGAAGNDHLVGGDGNDSLTGGTGADKMEGGLGDDIYYVDNAGDQVIEGWNAGTDRVFASVSYSIAGQYVEALTLTGTANLNAQGNSLDNVLTGNSGDNILRGEGGADTMIGGAGNDVYYVDRPDDAIVEQPGEGIDRVYASSSYGLYPGLERLYLTGTADLFASGNDEDNVIVGNSGNNWIDGWRGDDTMIGGLGNDTYLITEAGDRIVENAGEGIDTARVYIDYNFQGVYVENIEIFAYGSSIIANSLDNRIVSGDYSDVIDGKAGTDTVSYERAAYAVTASLADGKVSGGSGFDTLRNIENLSGSAYGDNFIGSSGDNRLDGALGADMLTGGGGADVFAFTTALGSGNIDKVTDFDAAHDRIFLSAAIFGAAGPAGTLADSRFAIGPAAADANDRIVYNPATGALSYDADGTGSGAAVQFATLSPGLALTHDLFTIG